MAGSLRAGKSRILYRWMDRIYIDRYTPKSIQRFIVLSDNGAQTSRRI